MPHPLTALRVMAVAAPKWRESTDGPAAACVASAGIAGSPAAVDPARVWRMAWSRAQRWAPGP